MPVTVIGVDKLTDEFNKLSRAAELSQDRFINTISKQTISLLKQNTPRDTGALANSWYEVLRTRDTTNIGVTSDQRDKLRYVIFGTRYIPANDFVTPILNAIGDSIEGVFRAYLKTSHPYMSNISTGTGGRIRTPANIRNPSNKLSKRAGQGTSGLFPGGLGQRKLSSKIVRRRKTLLPSKWR